MVYNIGRLYNTTTVVILLSSLLLIQTTVVTGFPNGAGGCAGGVAAVNGTHLGGDGRPVSNNTLLAGGVDVIIGNTTLDTNVPIDVSISTNHMIQIVSTQFPIRGILIRVQAPDGVDTTNVLTPGALLQGAVACVAPIVGTTHIDKSDKTEMSSTIRFDESVDSVILDITGVFLNSIEGSVYVYSRYMVNFVSEVAPTSPSPTSSPIEVETAEPTKTPTVGPITASPTLTPVMAETASPTATPVITKTTAPTSVPVTIQTNIPTTSPIGTSPAPTTMEPSMSMVPSQPSEETSSPIAIPTTITSVEPSLRGGMGKGMMMSKASSPPPTTKAPKSGNGMGMMATTKGIEKVKQEKEVMKKSKIEVDIIDKKHSMMKLSKDDE
jgi:hypothetical protein